MEIKVHCSCGTRYKFDAEPVNGLMPFTVNCPVCNADGTAAANEVIQQMPGEQAPPAGTTPAPVPAATPAPQARLRINRPAHSETSASSPGSSSPPAPALRSAPTPRKASQSHPASISKRTNYLLGFVGAGVAAVVGMMIWYLLIKFTGYEIGIVAWGVGAVTGLGARLLGREGSFGLGLIAGACATVAIVGGLYLAANSFVTDMLREEARDAYETRMAYAQEAVKAQTDEQIRALLAREYAEEGSSGDPSSITAEDIKDFREHELPELKEFVNGKPSREEFEKNIMTIMGSFIGKFALLKEVFGLFTALWLLLGVGSAYKIANGEGEAS